MIRLLAILAATASTGLVLGQERVAHALGEFEYVAAPNGIVIGAPHGTFDANTAALAIDAASRTGGGYVLARDFAPNKVRINVNRPTEGAFLACAKEAQTGRAQNVYEVYSGLVAKAASGRPLRLYVEVHGNSNPQTAQHVEIATVGITAAQAQAVKDEYPAMLSRVRGQFRDFPELVLLIEPLDRITYTAACAKKLGVLAREFAPRGIHFEFPRSARERNALPGSAMLVAEVVRRLIDQ